MEDNLKSRLEAAIKDAEDAAAKDPLTFIGTEWWQLLPGEERVIGIDPSRWPCMMTTWDCFEAFIEASSGSEWDRSCLLLLETARVQYPDLINGRRDEIHFGRFAMHFGQLTSSEVHAVVLKITCWERRSGVIQYQT